MNERYKQIVKDLSYQLNITLLEEHLEDIMNAVVKECARVADNSNQMKNRPAGQSVGDVVRQTFGVK